MRILERRLKGRYLCADLVSVIWQNDTNEGCSEPRTVQAVLEDISALGACVQVEEAIPLDVAITLSIGEKSFSGRVCYSAFREYGQFVGIRFAEDTVWSADMVIPQHLTNLEAFSFDPERGI